MMKRVLTIPAIFICVKILSQPTSYSDDFSGTIKDGWDPHPAYTLTQSDDVLKVDINKTEEWVSFIFDLADTYDFSGNPFLNVKARSSRGFVLKAYLFDGDNQTSEDVRIYYTDEQFVNCFFDFSASGTVDLSSVDSIGFAVNGAAKSVSGTLWLDNLIVGNGAQKLAGIGGIKDQVFYTGTTARNLFITDLMNVSSLLLTGGDTLVENIEYSEINADGTTTITFDCIAGKAGSDLMTLTAQASAGYMDNQVSFNLVVEDNIAPLIDSMPTIETKVMEEVVVHLTGISDGNSSIEQDISILANSSDTLIVPDPIPVDYISGYSRATMSVTPLTAGTTTITLTLTDNGDGQNSSNAMFDLVAYDEFNNPPDFGVEHTELFLSEENMSVLITGITDGDGDDPAQALFIEVMSLDETIVSDASIFYIEGNPRKPRIDLTAAAVGEAYIQVSVSDDGGTAGNNGDQETIKTFRVTVKQDPLYGYTIPISEFEAEKLAGKYKLENLTTQTFSLVEFMGDTCLKIQMSNKNTWTGFWYRNPELDVTEHPFISYDIYSVDQDIQTHAYFWDNAGKRNADGAHAQRKDVPKNQWTHVLLDFRGKGLLVDDEGNNINTMRIDTLLFNYHESFGWPFTDISGTVYFKNIKIGDHVTDAPDIPSEVTINPVPNQFHFAETGDHEILLKGISDGNDGSVIPSLSLSSSNEGLLDNLNASTVDESGMAVIHYTTNTETGIATISVTAEASGSTSKTVEFNVEVIQVKSPGVDTIKVDRTLTRQTIDGFGSHAPREFFLDMFIEDMGANTIRFFFTGDAFEPVNDNNDATVLNKDAFNLSALQLDYIRQASEKGIEHFFVTVLSPPSWMKQNLSENYFTPASPDWSTTKNKVEPYYYDEYAEYMLAIVKYIKDETGIELAGICPQNEPMFCEPYGSAILSPEREAEVAALLGQRLEDEGFETEVIFFEHPWEWGWWESYMSGLRANPEADEYSGIFGLHYPSNDVNKWRDLNIECKKEPVKKIWATECSAEGNDWSAVLGNINTIITGLNHSLSNWVLYGFNGPAVLSDDYNPVGSQVAVVYGSVPSKHYYALKNIFRFIRPGSVNLVASSSSFDVKVAAFEYSEEQTLTLLLVNNSSQAKKIKLEGDIPSEFVSYRSTTREKCELVSIEKDGRYLLPPRSISTLVANTNLNHAPTIDVIPDMTAGINSGLNTITLTGITDGDVAEQNIILYQASSSHHDIIPDPVIVYSGGNTASLSFEPVTDASGIVTVTITLQDDGGTDNGGNDTRTLTFNVNVTDISLTPEVEIDNFTVYPVPAENMLKLYGLTGGNYEFAIFNSLGQCEHSGTIANPDQSTINIEKLEPGIYMISVSGEQKVYTRQFIKQ